MTVSARGSIAAALGGALMLWLGSGLSGQPGPTVAATGPVTPDSLPSIEELARSFEAGGDPSEGRAGIRLRAAAEGPARGTLWVQLLAVVERVDPEVAPVAVRAVGLAREGEGLVGAEILEEEAGGAAAPDRPALLQLAAILAEAADAFSDGAIRDGAIRDGEIRDGEVRAAEIRRRILDEYPDSYEAPEAALREARRLLRTEEGRAEGLALLEELIVGAPAHPIAPQARRLFEVERARSPQQDVRPGGSRR